MPPTNTPEPEVNSVWAQAAPVDTTDLITLPSGQTARVRRIGLEGVMTSGLLGEADSLTQFVGKQHVRRVRGGNGRADGEEVDPRSIMKDPESLKKIVRLVDRVTPLVVVDPVVHLHLRDVDNGPGQGADTEMIPQADRVPGAIYTDMIGLQDKMFLFQYALGGARDLERFRDESSSAVGDVADGEEVQRSSQSADAPRPKRKRRKR